MVVNLAAMTVMAGVTAWPYLRHKAPGLGPRSSAEEE